MPGSGAGAGVRGSVSSVGMLNIPGCDRAGSFLVIRLGVPLTFLL